ncbi:uncharacterized protein LOC128260705 [Drosophila gunungcola]|uniref:Uncharacterized protein n=1 Tax=Drosophila gunungcola TaxID=103775 RepID=A0A9Q0BL48_9MUSC|nr:uncharacterized protein LOC128260705 [Drosophila gunungcola]KAI8035434.1 hypothetical protein M5D96_011777 [Drosophila gunungcola]
MSGDGIGITKSRGGGGARGSGSGASASETDNVTALELQSNKRILYFSDGVMEELSSSEDEADGELADKCYDGHLNESEMALGPRLRYKASRMGNRFLAGIDYVGGGLAHLLGITSSKYASEMENYHRAKENGDEDLDNWQPQASANNNQNETIVLCGPTRSEATLPPTRQ